jgi:hypothetical protein
LRLRCTVYGGRILAYGSLVFSATSNAADSQARHGYVIREPFGLGKLAIDTGYLGYGFKGRGSSFTESEIVHFDRIQVV